MPRLRRPSLSSEFQTAPVEQLRLEPIGPTVRSVRDPVEFLLAVVELERVRGLRVHPESPTRH
jgi:hypothetical protein